jgi:hypothetical protein
MRTGRGQAHAVFCDEPEEPVTSVLLLHHRVRERRALPRADLDLGRDQLAGDRLREWRVGAFRGIAQLLESLDELERLGVEDLELLLDADREVLGVLEDLACTVHVEHFR